MGLQIPVLDAASVGATACKFPNDLQKRLEHLQKEASSGDVTRFLVLPPTHNEVKRKKRSAQDECPADKIEDLPDDAFADLQDRSICPWKHIIDTNHER